MLMPIHDIHFKESTNTPSNVLEEIIQNQSENIFSLYLYFVLTLYKLKDNTYEHFQSFNDFMVSLNLTF
jgi:hypothetical protein